ncbi:MAG: TonB-dependent receptor [Bacteroidales bacterium]|nr:TonB-dependent receptor [Bacteroidales bacterium]
MKRQQMSKNRNYLALSSTGRILLCLLFFIVSTGLVFAQKTITGTVTGTDKTPLPGVSLSVVGTTTGTITDINGKYSLSVPSDAKTILFTFVGMESKEVSIGAGLVYDVTLNESLVGLNEVVVVGYGEQSRARLTTSISKLDTKVLANVPYANVASSLQGAIAGLQVQTTTGMPGAAPRIIIRGGTSINNPGGATPLYIIDGIIRTDMNDLDQSDIESIQVLKDAASTAIYGARGSNGVVIIVTKSGKSGRTQINYRYDMTTSNNVDDLNMLGARDYIYFQRMGIMASAERKPSQLAMLTQANSAGTGNDLTNLTAFSTQYLTDENRYKLDEGWQSMPDPADPSKTIIFSDTDFQSKLFQTGIAQNHSISASGGTETTTFEAGLGFIDQSGIVITSKYTRLNAHLNGELKVNKKVKVFGRLLYSNSSNNEPPTGTNLFGRSQGIPPTAKYKYEDGTLACGVNTSLGNPEYVVGYTDSKNSNQKLSVAVGGHWDILPGLAFDPQISLFRTNYDSRYFERAYFNGPKAYNTNRSSSGSYSDVMQKQADAVFSYTKDINVHHFDAKAGFSYFGTKNNYLSASGKGAATDLISTLNAAATPVSVSGTEEEQLIFGYFGRINYDYNQKYLLSVNARYDGASNLGAGNKWGFFPGVSLGWNVYEEEFWKTLPEKLLRLKLRASYGVNGNISGLGYYTAQGAYSVGTKYNGYSAIQNTSLANSELQWEQSKTLDFGFDLGVLDERITILFDVYRRVTDNLLASLSLPESTGFSSMLTNLGSLENKGVEVEFRASIMPATSKFQWDVALNASTVKNKILKLPSNGVENNRVGGYYVWDADKGDYAWKGGLQEGGTMGDYYAYKQIGVYATDAEAASAPMDVNVPQTDRTKHGGDVNFLDADGNNIIDSKDMTYVGNIYPKGNGGFSNTFSFKNFTLNVRMDYTVGQTIFNYTYGSMIGQFQGDNGLSKDLLRSWQKQGDITDIPRFYWADQQASNNLYRAGNGTSLLYEKGNFLALRELTLAYDLPKSLLQKVKISALRVNITGNNLHYFTKYRGVNPEDGGRTYGRYPIPRNIIFGVNVTL